MNERCVIEVAGHVVALDCRYGYTPWLCRRFVVDGEPELVVSVDEAAIDAEDVPDGEQTYSRGYLESLALLRRLCEALAPLGVSLVHGVALSLDERGYLFTAPSGTGKSTHARLWGDCFGSRMTVVNGDKPFVTIDPDGVPRMWGSPWCGKESVTSTGSVRLDAIGVIARSTTNRATRISPFEVVRALMPEVYRGRNASREMAQAAMNLVKRFVELPVYRIECDMSQRAVEVSYAALSECQPPV